MLLALVVSLQYVQNIAASALHGTSGPNVLVVYAADQNGQTKQVAQAVVEGAESKGAFSRLLEVEAANYKRDVHEWADAVVVGSPVYNGNAMPAVFEFINSFDFSDDLSMKVGGSFSTGGAASAGISSVTEQIMRGLRTFGLVTVGGSNWRNAGGTGVVTNGTNLFSNSSQELELARDEGSRVTQLAFRLKDMPPQPQPGPQPSPVAGNPPTWGERWTASIAANLSQVGYDAGLVIVNFSAICGSDPHKQQMLTVYGDFDTVLTRCDMGYEFIIDPPSRGGNCRSRIIGQSANPRICEACGCPFCVRDTNGTFTHGEQYPSRTSWRSKRNTHVEGIDVMVWDGVAVSTGGQEAFNIKTSIAYTGPDFTIPVFVNVSHPLWVQTQAHIQNFSHNVVSSSFEIPSKCFRSSEDSAELIV